MVTFRATPYPGYFAGADGVIYSAIYRKKGANYPLSPRALKAKQPSNPKGYLGCTVKESGRFISKDIHVIVCTSFHGPRPSKKHSASHINGDNKDNRPSNLKWELHVENLARKKEHGTDDCGHKNSRAKLTESDLADVRKRLSNGELHAEIAKDYNVARATISKINNKSRYGGV